MMVTGPPGIPSVRAAAVHTRRTGWYLFFAALTDCQSGVWAKSKVSTIIRQNSGYESTSVSCANNEYLTGGGAQCDPGSSERLKWSNPNGNGWAAACPRESLTVFAICATN